MMDPLRPTRTEIPLSVPHLGPGVRDAIERAIESNWIAPIGPEVDAFEEEMAATVGAGYALATTSGTAAIHLALRVLGVQPGDEVLVSTLTFCASANPILYQGGRPVFVDADRRSWNMDADRLEEEIERRGSEGHLPAAVIVVHLYGQPADMTRIQAVCERWGVPIVEDAAAALGAVHEDRGGVRRHVGTIGDMGIYSFDGSKVITTSMGGLLVSDRKELIEHARKLARQAREPVPHYEHEEVGFNYRMSNLLAAIGRTQLRVLEERVDQRRGVFDSYHRALGDIDGVAFQSSTVPGRPSRWLTAILLDPDRTGTSPEAIRIRLRAGGIESRPLWKPLHLQPVYQRMGLSTIGGEVAEELFAQGLCLPSSSSLTTGQIERISTIIRECIDGA